MAMIVAIIPITTACSAPQTVTVSFNTMGGNTIPHQTITSGSTATRPQNDPIRTGFTFDDWFTAQTGGTVFNFQAPINSNTTIYARWNPIPVTQFRVTFYAMGGSETPYQMVNEGGFARIPTIAPTKDGHDFVGWFATALGAILFSFDTPITANTTAYARWEAVDVDNPFPVVRALTTQTLGSIVNVTYDSESRDIAVPRIYDYYTDGNYNFFLFQIGMMRQTFVSEIFPRTQNPGGMVTINMVQTSTNTTEVTEGITSSGSRSVTTTHEAGASVTLSYSFRLRKPFTSHTLSASVTGHYRWSEATNNTRSWSTDISTAVSHGTTETFGVTIGPNAEPGWYRAALFATAEIFIILQTNRDNSDIVSMDEIAIASGFSRAVEFCPGNAFDNTPEDPFYVHNVTDEWFLRALPVPNMNFESISVGSSHTAAITANGELWAWGTNVGGRLGDGTFTHRYSPVRIGFATNWATVSAGNTHTAAITTSGELWAWGINGNSGQLGDGTTINRNIPTRIGYATNWATVSTGSSHTIAITTNGELWAWGNNGQGRLGDGTTTNRLVPTRIGYATNWSSVSAGSAHTVAITTNGQLWSWGWNSLGRLGDGTTTDRHIPTRIGSETNWRSVSANTNTIAITTTGELWAWGSNSQGQLGDGTTTDRHVPTRIGDATNWRFVSAGGLHTAAITTNGELWAWGINGTTSSSHVPARIGGETNWVAVSAGGLRTIAETGNGQLWAWGNNGQGQLGDGTTINRYSPVHIL